jgi:hypothetical protein
LSDDGGFCSAPPSPFETETASSKPLYWRVTNPTLSPSHLQGHYIFFLILSRKCMIVVINLMNFCYQLFFLNYIILQKKARIEP